MICSFAETEEETAYTADYLPDVSYDGYEYRIIEYEEYLLYQEEAAGSVMDDAIYQRNLLAEEKFDINITSKKCKIPSAKDRETFSEETTRDCRTELPV